MATGVLTDEEMLLAEFIVAAARAGDPALYVAVARLNHLQGTVELRFVYRVVRIALELNHTDPPEGTP
ncbi:hypothetical protein ABGB19_02100 [Mycobacterium sp. B14F4]|uniref:hypothetical protein n=1 Tax=Mycobacterium sp. B14F4 TaxID=3153565 RepID=UPI00325E79FF